MRYALPCMTVIQVQMIGREAKVAKPDAFYHPTMNRNTWVAGNVFVYAEVSHSQLYVTYSKPHFTQMVPAEGFEPLLLANLAIPDHNSGVLPLHHGGKILTKMFRDNRLFQFGTTHR